MASKRLRRAYWRAYDALLPGVAFSGDLYMAALTEHVTLDTRWLDVGCGRHLLPRWYAEEEQALTSTARLVVGIDADLESLLDNTSIRQLTLGTTRQLSFANDSFDLVSANMVVEHLDDPRTHFAEIHRVLRPGGFFVFHTPNRSGYSTLVARSVPERLKRPLARIIEGRGAADVFPAYYAANSVRRITELAEGCGFDVVRLERLNSPPATFKFAPVAVVELLLIKALMARRLEPLRTKILAVLQKGSSEGDST